MSYDTVLLVVANITLIATACNIGMGIWIKSDRFPIFLLQWMTICCNNVRQRHCDQKCDVDKMCIWKSSGLKFQSQLVPYSQHSMNVHSAETSRNNKVIIMPNDFATSFWRNNDVIITSGVHWVRSYVLSSSEPTVPTLLTGWGPFVCNETCHSSGH